MQWGCWRETGERDGVAGTDGLDQPVSAVDRLAQEAARAARLRALALDPDVIALRVERVRVQVDRLMWAGIVLGLGFTMANVQAFAAAGAVVGSIPWAAAWVLDPMVSLVLVAVLRAEQVTARWQIRTGPWVRRARWSTLAATYVMNTWSAWAAGIPALVVLHSVPPLMVFVAAEAVTGLREALTDAVYAAARSNHARTDRGPDAEAANPAAARALAEDEPRSAPVSPPGPLSTGGDARVGELVELLAAGAPVTGAQVAALFGCSPRTGRRLLTRAQALTNPAAPRTPAAAGSATAPVGRRGELVGAGWTR